MTLGSWFATALCAGLAGTLLATTAMTEPDTRAREALITGKPPRIQPLAPEEFTDEVRRAIEATGQIRSQPGTAPAVGAAEVPEIFRTMVRHPELYTLHAQMARLFFRGALSPRDRELAILRVGWLCQAPFEWGEHVPIGRSVGLSGEEIERVTRGSEAPGWSDHDRAILRAVEELRDDAMISDDTWSVLAGDLDDRQLIELVMLVGQYETVAYYQNALRLRLRAGNRGLSAR
jgi:alkylhydroperoxidase family enzyme